ncbi:MAG: hypothetical protein HY854_00505 [Burkholderiales bacterium]|nr:hypothetical protein [Burkholderiales bacterium]
MLHASETGGDMEEPSAVEKIKQADAARPGFPGEHWLVLAIGVGLWQVTRQHRLWAVRTLGLLGASMLVARAASGREGLSKVLGYTPLGSRVSRCPPATAPRWQSPPDESVPRAPM